MPTISRLYMSIIVEGVRVPATRFEYIDIAASQFNVTYIWRRDHISGRAPYSIIEAVLRYAYSAIAEGLYT